MDSYHISWGVSLTQRRLLDLHLELGAPRDLCAMSLTQEYSLSLPYPSPWSYRVGFITGDLTKCQCWGVDINPLFTMNPWRDRARGAQRAAPRA